MKTIVRAHKRRLRSGKVVKIKTYTRNSKNNFIIIKQNYNFNQLPSLFSEWEYQLWVKQQRIHPDRVDISRKKYRNFLRLFNSFSYPLTIYRSVFLLSEEELDKSRLGVHWSYDKSYAIPGSPFHTPPNFVMRTGWEKQYPHLNYILETKVNKLDIDWQFTYEVYSNNDNNEREVVLRNGTILSKVFFYKRNRKRKGIIIRGIAFDFDE